MRTDWLKLSEVAERLGVHPSTIRNWADKGKLPSHRTQGGHRHFHRDEFDLWEKSQRASVSKEEATKVVQSALGYTRLQISQGHLEKLDWYKKLDKAAREEYARGGRKLMQGLSRFIASEDELGRAEARATGYDYASLGRRHGLNSLEATRALLFFRKALSEALLVSYEDAAIHSVAAWSEMARKTEAYIDEVLLSLLATYRAFETGRK